MFRTSLLPISVLVVLAPMALFAQSAPVQTPAGSAASNVPVAARPSEPRPDAQMMIGNGDLLEVSVFGAPDYKHEVRVNDEGMISLPLIGPVKVAGMTATNAARSIANQLSSRGLFNNPQVSVTQKEFATQGIAVLGEVQKPGIYPLLGQHTLFDAISAAGGITNKAGRTATVTHRESPAKPETVSLAFDSNHAVQANVALRPGDTVLISKAGLVYVVGEVNKPSGIVMESPKLTVLQAIALAEGTKPTASLDHAKLVRSTPNGPTEMTLPLKKLLAAKAPDMPLQPDDIIFVPGSTAKSAGKRGLDTALQTLTGIAIYGRGF